MRTWMKGSGRMVPPEVSPADSSFTNHDKGRWRSSVGGGRFGGFGHFRFKISICAVLAVFVLLQRPDYIQGQATQNPVDPKQGEGKNANDNRVKINATHVKLFMEKYNKQRNMTYFQLVQWFENQTANLEEALWITSELYPRLYPFCVTLEQLENPKLLKKGTASKLYAFRSIFEAIREGPDVNDRFYHFDPNLDSGVFNTTFIKEVKISRITTPDPDMVNLRQWFHVTIHTTGLKGLFLQSLAGPVGLPSGQFEVNFQCQDEEATEGKYRQTRNYDSLGEIQYCHYRPKANIYHPTVYVAYSTSAEQNFHVHYKYSDITCMETPYVQFLMIAVKRFGKDPVQDEDYQLLFSPVFQNTASDSKDGTPYPYYPTWRNEMGCYFHDKSPIAKIQKVHPKYHHDGAEKPVGWTGDNPKPKKNGDHKVRNLTWEQSPDVFRIQPNEEYDACVMNKSVEHVKARIDYSRLECPPGPFKCTQSYKALGGDAAENAVKDLRDKLVHSERDNADCFPCAAPACFAVGFSRFECTTGNTAGPVHINDTQVLEGSEAVARSKGHGMLAVFSSLVLMPLANFVGRFYKEVCRNCLCGNGPWIFLHIVMHILSLILLWVSIGPVVGSIESYSTIIEDCKELYGDDSSEAAKCATEKSIGNPHVPLGIIVFLLQNLVFIFSFFRASNNKFRWIQVLLHSHIGYLTFIFVVPCACVAVYDEKAPCPEAVAFIIIMVLLCLIFYGAACAMDIMSDKRIGIVPMRKLWPVLEPVKLDRRGPFDIIKWVLFVAHVVLSMLIWLMIVISSNNAVSYDGDKFDPGNENLMGLYDTFQNDSTLQGLFGVCGDIAAA